MKMLRKQLIFPVVLLISLMIAPGLFAQEKTRIICYNILEGMKNDTSKTKVEFANWVKGYDPDILALQEVNKFTQKSLEALSHSYGHPYAVLLKEPGYPVALTSKQPIINVRKVIDNMHHGFILAETDGYNIMVVHLSPHQFKKRREEIKVILQTIQSYPNQNKWIVMGDFNSLSPVDKEFYEDGTLVKRMQESAKKYSFHNNLIDGKFLDFTVQQEIIDAGFIDSYKLKNPSKKRGSRIDYIYTSKDLKDAILNSTFLEDDFTKDHSDHVPVMMDLKN